MDIHLYRKSLSQILTVCSWLDQRRNPRTATVQTRGPLNLQVRVSPISRIAPLPKSIKYKNQPQST